MRRETLEKVQAIASQGLREMNSLAEFDEGLFETLVERVRVLNLVQAEFGLRAGGGVIERI